MVTATVGEGEMWRENTHIHVQIVRTCGNGEGGTEGGDYLCT